MSDTHSHQLDANVKLAFVREEMVESSPPPPSESGVIGWIRAKLFSSITNILLTVLGILLIYFTIPPLVNFALIDAVWTADGREECLGHGACWPYIADYFKQFIYGPYPNEELWRVNLTYLIGAIGIVWLAWDGAPQRGLISLLMLTAYPLFAFILLTGGDFELSSGFLITSGIIAAAILALSAILPIATKSNPLPSIIRACVLLAVLAVIFFLVSFDFGLGPVETEQWGGLLVTLVIAITGIVFSLPFGIILALGRISKLPIIRLLCVIFIEFWRGVPLITILFMADVMLPLFMPKGVTIDNLLRPMVGVALFASAYMAEVVRGGLQAIPKGQYEGAMALGLTYWQMMQKIILPQALKLVIPGIVNTFIGLFKDTTLVSIVGLFDLLGQIQQSYSDPTWATPYQTHTGYLFAALVFFIFCFGMSRYSLHMERKLDTGHRS